MALSAWLAAALLQPAWPQPPPRIDDEDYLRPVEAVRRFLQHGASSCEFAAVDARNLSRKAFRKLAAKSEGGLVLRGLTEPWLTSASWSKDGILERFGQYFIQTGTGRWDRPEATPEVLLEDFFLSANETAKNLVAKGYSHRLVSEAFWGPEGECSPSTVASWHCNGSAAKEISPKILADFDLRPTVQIGMSEASGTQLHVHEETWLAVLHGRKAWWIALKNHQRRFSARSMPTLVTPANGSRRVPQLGFGFACSSPARLSTSGRGSMPPATWILSFSALAHRDASRR